MKKNKNKNKKGITLIIVTSIMLVLSTTAVTFVRLAGYERTAATNFTETINAKLTAYAGIDHAIGLMYENIRDKGRLGLGETVNGVVIQYPENTTADIFRASQKNGATDPEAISLQLDIDIFGDGDTDENFAVSGFVGRRLGNDLTSDNIFGSSSELHSNFYSLKIEDNAGKFNVNSHVAVDEDLVTPNAGNQVRSNIILSRILKSLGDICFANDVMGDRISEFIIVGNPVTEEGIRFENDRVLEEGLRTIPGFDGDGADTFLRNVTTESFIDRQTFGTIVNAGDLVDLNDAPTYYRESRSPININTVSRELLTAIIENVKGRSSFYVNQVETEDDETFEDSFKTETTLNNIVTAFPITFSRENAQTIADEIIAARINAPFLDRGDIENFFVAEMDFTLDRPRLDDADNKDFVKGITGFDGNEITISEEAWDQAVEDTLRSNFNPNILDNFWNPNAAAHRRVSKGELLETIISGTSIEMTASHTTELTAFSVGSVNITSVGRITTQGGELVTGVSTIETTANFGNRITQTSQRQFEPSTGTLPNAMTSPENMRLQRLRGQFTPDNQAGAVEPATIVDLPNGTDTNDGSVLFFSETSFANENFNLSGQRYNVPDQWEIDATNSIKKIKYLGVESLPSLMTGKNTVRAPENNVAYDGLVSRKAYYSTLSGAPSRERYFIETAFDNIFSGPGAVNNYLTSRTDAEPNLRDNNSVADSKIANFSGSLQFWVKFDADTLDTLQPFNTGNDVSRTAFGLIGITTASGFRNGRAFGQADGDVFVDTNFREGTQMYIYMNALGELRVSRLYYALCFKIGSSEPYGAMFETDVDAENRRTARRDVVFQTNQKFQAHEWYHFRIRWDDTSQREASIDLFVNNQKLTNDGNIAEIELVDDNAIDVEYCLLNEEEPLDGFFINGFPRAQAKLGGYFHFNEDVHFVGNATIDDVISSTDEFFGSQTEPFERFEEISTFQSETGVSDIDEVIAAVRWTSYPPYRGDDIDDVNGQDQPRVRLSNINTGGSSSGIAQANVFSEGGELREMVVARNVLGDVNLTAGSNVNYTFEFFSPPPVPITDGKNSGANTFFQGASCATLDSVTIITMRKFPQLVNTIIQ